MNIVNRIADNLTKFNENYDYEFLLKAIEYGEKVILDDSLINDKTKKVLFEIAKSIHSYQTWKSHNHDDIASKRDIDESFIALKFAEFSLDTDDLRLKDFYYCVACYEKNDLLRKKYLFELDRLNSIEKNTNT